MAGERPRGALLKGPAVPPKGKRARQNGLLAILILAAAVMPQPGQCEAWNLANNPLPAGSGLTYRVNDLPAQGRISRLPVPGYVWPTARDSIQYRWDGDQSSSPAEKAERALNKPGFARAITDTVGIYGSGRPACDQPADCAPLADDSVCVAPRGAIGSGSGRCIPSWWGLSHGWAAYAVSEPAPLAPVMENGVTFYPADLDALMSLAYARPASTTLVGQRCNLANAPVDVNGRTIESSCRDLNPGSLHVLLGNRTGLQGRPLIMDRSAGARVSNNPIVGYRVTNGNGGALRQVSAGDAVALIRGGAPALPPALVGATLLQGETRTGYELATADGEVVVSLTGTGDADLYVRKGAPPDLTRYDCRPYRVDSAEQCRVPVLAGETVYWMVAGDGPSSLVDLGIAFAPRSTSYSYNTAARIHYHVLMEVDWFAHSEPSRSSSMGNGAGYVRTDSFEYILEVDASGKIIGGEWVGDSRQNHPDFVWWPGGAPSASLPASLTYGEIRALHDRAALKGTSTVCPASHPIKARFLDTTPRCTYYLPGSAFHDATAADRCYANEAEAQSDGCRPSRY